MGYTTPPPRIDVLTILRSTAERARWTIRLHPRRAQGLPADANKIGGSILWPKDEPWPECESVTAPDWWSGEWPVPADARIPLVPAIQLHAAECSDIQFFPGTDLLQVLWCPMPHSEPIFVAKPYVYWRLAADLVQARNSTPKSEFGDLDYSAMECRVYPERVQEFPDVMTLDSELQIRLDKWNISPIPDEQLENGLTLYRQELSTASGTKIGGYPQWIQDPEVPTCPNGHPMSFLLTFSDTEYDASTERRWRPVEDCQSVNEAGDEDEIRCAAFPSLGGGSQFIFVCRQCPDWPTANVYQR